MRDAVALREKTARPLANWGRLQEQMDRTGVDLVVAGTPANVTYLSDFWSVGHWTRRSAKVFALAGRSDHREVGLVLPLGNADLISTDPATAPTFVVCYDHFVFTSSDGERPLEPEESQLLQRVAERGDDERDPLQGLALALREVGVGSGRVALEFDGLSPREAAELRDHFPEVEFVDAVPLLRATRTIKTAEEIARLRRAAAASEAAFTDAARATHPGDTELDVQRRFHAALAQRDAVPFLTSITAGARTALPNGQATDRRLEPGDGIRFDGGGRFGHYASDIARIAAFDGYSAKHLAYYQAVVTGLRAAAEVARPGVSGARVFETAVDTVRRAGIAHYQRSHCGHGIGIENYDVPRITPDSQDLLEPGMVICLETPYYEIGWGGVQAEDTYLVTDSGLEPFTATPPQPLSAGSDQGDSTHKL